MLQTTRQILVAATVALGALPAGLAPTGAAFAQPAGGQAEAPRQIVLTQAIIDSLIGAQPELAAAQAKAQSSNSDQPDPKMQAQLDAIGKKHGFASLGDYEGVADSVGIVLSGMDPETKTYVGPVALINKQMAQVEADKTLPPKDKAETLKEMKQAIATAGDTKPLPGNAELVAKNYDRLSEAFQSGE